MTQFLRRSPSAWVREYWLLWLIIILTVALRLYRISNPVADWHAFRQADTASVTREYIKHGVDLLHPKYQDLSNIQSGKDNLAGYRMVEFPLINAGIAVLIRTVPSLPLEVTSRLVAVFFSIGTLLALYGIAESLSGKKTALWTVAIYAVLPYAVYYSRVVLPEPFMLFFATTAIFSFQRWLKTHRWWWYVSTLVTLALALLLKPFVLFLGPVFAVLAIYKYQWSIIKRWELVVLAGLAVVPLWWWRSWIAQFPTGIPASDWLYNKNNIRFRPAWFRWLFWERIAKLMLGYTGVFFLPWYLLAKHQEAAVYFSWWLGILAYFTVMASGNVQHDYYQVLVIPILCMTVAKGVVMSQAYLAQYLSATRSCVIIGGVLAVSWWLAAQQVKGFFNVNHWEYVEAGAAVDRLVPPDAKLIAPAMGDTQFLFQTNRTGWPIGFEIDDKIAKGATHYVTTSDDDEARDLAAKYHVIETGQRYKIIDLTKVVPVTAPDGQL